MTRLLKEISRIYRERREDVDAQAAELAQAVRSIIRGEGVPPFSEGSAGDLGSDLVDRAARRLLQNHDQSWGGFGPAPKFPPAMGLSLLLRHHARTGDEEVRSAVRKTLERMALGGIYDHLGGGFARYSTDERWHVPHFEKMLYDNALLVSVYVEALQALGDDEGGLYRRVIGETLAFVARELTDAGGGFFSSLDADSEGEEGKFYVWTRPEVDGILGDEDAEYFAHYYDVSSEGNWEHGSSILWLRRPLSQLARGMRASGSSEGRMSDPSEVGAAHEGPDEELAQEALERLSPMKAKLLEARGRRIRPALDDKVLASWNGLMISAFARAGQALAEPSLIRSAERAADFVLENMHRDGRLLRTWRCGQARIGAYLEDYAFLAMALVDLYEATFDLRRLIRASQLVETALKHFGDDAGGGFYFTADDHEALLTRPRSSYDGAIPSGQSVMAQVLLRLALLLDRGDWRERAEKAIRAVADSLRQNPGAHHQMLAAVDWLDSHPLEVALVGPAIAPETKALLAEVRRGYCPNKVVALLDPLASDAAERERSIPLLRGKGLVADRPAAYVCRNFACQTPVTTPGDLRRVLKSG
jgi:hypothetical protein